VRAVARKAGYTTGALVHYFGDKNELIRLALDYSGEVVRDRMVAVHQRQRGRNALREIIVEALPLDKQRDANGACGSRSGITRKTTRTCAPKRSAAIASGPAARTRARRIGQGR
jgi:AcrR family transcriptional regulator